MCLKPWQYLRFIVKALKSKATKRVRCVPAKSCKAHQTELCKEKSKNKEGKVVPKLALLGNSEENEDNNKRKDCGPIAGDILNDFEK